MQRRPKGRWRRQLLRWIGGAVLTVVLTAVFFVTVVLGQPQQDMAGAIDPDQPLTAPSPAINLAPGQSADELTATFPAQVLSCAPGGTLTLEGGVSYDLAFEEGVARVLTLRYVTAEGMPLEVTTIYPARALALLRDDSWRLTGAGPAMAGLESVRMEKDGQVRLHAQGPAGVYAVTVQAVPEETLKELLRPLQLLGT